MSPHGATSTRSRTSYEDRCVEALDRALESAPAYRAWRDLDPGPLAGVQERYAALPWLTKAMLREGGVEAFIPAGRDLAAGLQSGEIELGQTSGSTGDRVTNIWYQAWWDASERSSWGLNIRLASAGLGAHREVILTSPHCTGFPCEDGYLDISARKAGRFLYLNERGDPTTWTAVHMDRMLHELDSFAPAVLEANPSFLARLCRHIIRRGGRVGSTPLVIATYEAPLMTHRSLARVAMGTDLVSSYGTTESGTVFVECEAGRLHQNVEACAVDYLPFSPEHGGPWLGRILVTTFDNPWRALVRFDTGDVVRLEKGACQCGRAEGLTLAGVEGRVTGLTTTTTGSAVTQAEVDRSLSGIRGLSEYRLVQTGRSTYEIAFVSGGGRRDRRRIAREIRESLGQIYGSPSRVLALEAQAIHPDPPGKYKPTRSRVPLDERALHA